MSRFARTLLAGAAVCAVASIAPASAGAAAPCTRYAAPGGSDAADGSEAQPFETVAKLADSLGPGETGCLRAGRYLEDVSVRRGGTAGAPLTLRGYPGERAEIVGIFYVARSAPHVTVERLWLNGRNPDRQPSPQVNAADTTFSHNDVTNEHTGICFILGEQSYGRAIRTVIDHNRIHNCGRLPSTNFDHGIYIAASDDVRISDNWIYDNADWGVHLYPDAQGTIVEGNVIDGNGKGVTFAGDDGRASKDNLVQGNVIANSKLRFNVDSWWPEGNPIPEGAARANCLGPSKRDDYDNGGIDVSQAIEAGANAVVSDPGYANASARDLRLATNGRCAEVYSGDNTIPGPDGGAALSRPAPAHVRSRITLFSRRHALRRGERTLLRGRVAGTVVRRGLRVRLVARTPSGRRKVAMARIRGNGSFAVRPRLRVRPGAVRVQALVRGVGRSRSVRLRVR